MTETWFRLGQDLDDMAQDLNLGDGVGTIYRNRRKQKQNRVAYDRVAIFFTKSLTTLHEIKFQKP